MQTSPGRSGTGRAEDGKSTEAWSAESRDYTALVGHVEASNPPLHAGENEFSRSNQRGESKR